VPCQRVVQASGEVKQARDQKPVPSIGTGFFEWFAAMTGIVYDDIYLRHDTGEHPESAERLRVITAHLKKAGLWDSLKRIAPRCATEDEIKLVHAADLVRRVESVAKGGGGNMDADTVVSEASYEVALWAAGGALNAVDAVMAGHASNALCLLRPPGHHATPVRAMGFCLFNNVAIAARYVQRKHGVKRVLIVDWDVHHGNGTQDTFYRDGSVMYFSTHRYPFYPGTGRRDEIGEGPGQGLIVNVPLPFNTRPETLIQEFEDVMKTKAGPFKPEFVIISAGFDAYRRDPIGGLNLEPEHFRTLTDLLKGVADASAKGRIVSCLEGGYSLTGLPLCVEQHVRALVGL